METYSFEYNINFHNIMYAMHFTCYTITICVILLNCPRASPVFVMWSAIMGLVFLLSLCKYIDICPCVACGLCHTDLSTSFYFNWLLEHCTAWLFKETWLMLPCQYWTVAPVHVSLYNQHTDNKHTFPHTSTQYSILFPHNPMQNLIYTYLYWLWYLIYTYLYSIQYLI